MSITEQSVYTSSSPCSKPGCLTPKGTFVFRRNGDLVFNFEVRHNGDWHRDNITLREMLSLAAARDKEALKTLLEIYLRG